MSTLTHATTAATLNVAALSALAAQTAECLELPMVRVGFWVGNGLAPLVIELTVAEAERVKWLDCVARRPERIAGSSKRSAMNEARAWQDESASDCCRARRLAVLKAMHLVPEEGDAAGVLPS